MGDEVLELSGVTKRYGDFLAVDRVSFAAPKGKILGLLGPNGAGKTSTLRMILGITPPTQGSVAVFGRQPAGRAVQRRIGYLPEERGLYRRMSARDTIVYFAKLKGMWAGKARRRADELLDELGLGHVKDRKIEALSKGMAQKVHITAIAHEPELVILDEPFSGLDPINQNELEAAIRRLAAAGTTVLFSTHTMSHAERLCDRFVILVKGSKAFDGTLADARAAVPRTIKLESPNDLSFLSGVKGVTKVVPPVEGSTHWDVVMVRGADPQAVLAACFEHGVKLTFFDTSPPTLHEIFVTLAGGDVGDAEP